VCGISESYDRARQGNKKSPGAGAHHPQPAVGLQRAGIACVDKQDGFPVRQPRDDVCIQHLKHALPARGLIDADRT